MVSIAEYTVAKLEIKKWQDQVRAVIQTGDTLAILQSLAMVAVQDPDHCDCDPQEKNYVLSLYCLCHRRFNFEVMQIIRSSEGLRRKLIDECRRELQCDQDPGATNGPWGRAITHHYAKQLMNNFLIVPRWCLPHSSFTWSLATGSH